MNTAKIVVLAISVAAGGVAVFLLSGPEPKQEVQAPAAQMDTVDILVAKSDIPLGQTVGPNDLQWQTWPAASASQSFIRRNQRPEALRDYTGAIARSSFVSGEPIRDTKLVKGPGSGIMAAILPTGMRAISTEISPETGAGGFILPNDRVDVILTRREKSSDRNAADRVISEIILSNVRVLAIDQTIEEKNGQKVVVGKTATVELSPDQAEVLARSRQTGTLTLALRSIVDANAPTTPVERMTGTSVNIVRFGVPSAGGGSR
jgi:pilus assembly protein CpaB